MQIVQAGLPQFSTVTSQYKAQLLILYPGERWDAIQSKSVTLGCYEWATYEFTRRPAVRQGDEHYWIAR